MWATAWPGVSGKGEQWRITRVGGDLLIKANKGVPYQRVG